MQSYYLPRWRAIVEARMTSARVWYHTRLYDLVAFDGRVGASYQMYNIAGVPSKVICSRLRTSLREATSKVLPG